MSLEEVPNWIKDTPKLLEEKAYGRGNRIRTKVNYQENGNLLNAM